MMKNIDINQLPDKIRLEISKEDLLAFAKELKEENLQVEDKEENRSEPPIGFKEMCSFVGIAPSTGYQKVNNGEIPHFKKGRKLYFRKSELLKWIESGRRKTKDDVDVLAEKYLREQKGRTK